MLYFPDKVNRLLTILTISALTLAALWSDAATGPRSRPRSKEGDYTLIVAGIVSGTGTAWVSGDQLTISAGTEGGAKGTILATLTLTNNHFDGAGTVMGQSATFVGRLDQPDDATERTIKGVRLTCTFKTANLEYGRIIGNMPSSTATTRPTTGGSGGGRPTTRPEDRDKDRGNRAERAGERSNDRGR